MSPIGFEAYRRSAQKGYAAFRGRLGLRPESTLISLVPRPELWPDSSLATMIQLLAEGGVPVVWSTPETLIDNLSEQVQAQRPAGLEATRDIVLFGTTMHHHLVAAELARRNPASWSGSLRGSEQYRLVVVDTGGAKGKTIVVDAAAQAEHLRRCYTQSPLGHWHDVVICSEYGMCELASQAWSLPNTLRSFMTSPELSVLAVDPETLNVTMGCKPGLLAFYDQANTDSYPALLTEDLGSSKNAQEFELFGRAPMASIKGCSLRVGGLPPLVPQAQAEDATPNPAHEPSQSPQQQLSSAGRGEASMTVAADQELTARARPLFFTEREWRALGLAWDSWLSAAADSRMKRDTRANGSRKLLIVAAANASIALLYPICAAWEHGYSSVVVSLPGVRDDDPLAPLVRQQIQWLISQLQTRFLADSEDGLQITTSTAAMDNYTLRNVDTLLLFGSNETIQVYQSALEAARSNARLIGMGDVTNVMNTSVDADATTLAETCLAWRGRGCLTPRAIVVRDDSKGKGDIQAGLPLLESGHSDFANRLAAALTSIHAAEFADVAPDVLRLYHWHSLKEIAASTRGQARILGGRGCAVVDIRHLLETNTEVCTPRTEVDLGLAGQGLVYLVDDTSFQNWLQFSGLRVQRYDPNPGYGDLHLGKSWRDWLA